MVEYTWIIDPYYETGFEIWDEDDDEMQYPFPLIKVPVDEDIPWT